MKNSKILLQNIILVLAKKFYNFEILQNVKQAGGDSDKKIERNSSSILLHK